MGKSTIIIKNNIRIHAVDMTDVAQAGINAHQTTPLSSLILSTAISTFGALASLKENMDTSVVFKVNGVVKNVVVETKHNGSIRALVGNRNIVTDYDDKNINEIPIKVGMGEKGMLHVTNFIGDSNFGSQVEMAKGDIVTDLAYYLDQSEQTNSAVVSDVNFKDKKTLNRAYTVIFQLLPGSTEEDIEYIENFIKSNKLSTMTIDEYISKIDGEVKATKDYSWVCEFTKERAIEMLNTIPLEERKQIIEENGSIEIKDQFCNIEHSFNKANLD